MTSDATSMENTGNAASGSRQGAEDVAHHRPPLSRARARRIYTIIAVVVAALFLSYLAFRILGSNKEATDDAQVAADVVSVAARVPGQVTTISIADNQTVRKGQLIAEIDPRDFRVKVQQAQSELEMARAQAADALARVSITRAEAVGGLQAATAAVQSSRETVDTSASAIREAQASVDRAAANEEKARLDYQRASELGGKGDISRAQVDAARAANESSQADLAAARARLASAQNNRQASQANVSQAQGKLEQSSSVNARMAAAQAQANLAKARVSSAQAVLESAQLALSYTRIYAPSDGIASKLSVYTGSLISAGQPVVQLVPQRTYVIANFKETQMEKVRVGQPARVKIDMLGGREFEGKVESLSGGTGASFSLLPPDNASGNFVKVVQRIPLRISWSGPPSSQVPVGSSAEVTIHTK